MPKYILTPDSSSSGDLVYLPQVDKNDFHLLFQVVDEAETLGDIEAGLDQLRRMFYNAPIGVVKLAQIELESIHRKVTLLLSSCHQFIDETAMDITQRKEMSERALVLVRFLEWLLQTPVGLNAMHPTYTYLHPILKQILEWTIQQGYKEETVACASVMIRISHVDTNMRQECQNFHDPGNILDMFITLRLDATESTNLRYQQMVTAYLLPLTQCVISFNDYTNPSPNRGHQPAYQPTLIKAVEIFRLSGVDHSAYPELTTQLRQDWRNLPQEHHGAVWVKTFLLMLGWVPHKDDDGRRVSTRSTDGRHRAKLISMLANSPPSLPTDNEDYMADRPREGS